MADIKTASGEGSQDPTTKKVVGGWDQIRNGQRESRQQRILRESQEKAERVRQGLPAEKQTGFLPGQEPQSEEFSLKKMKEHMRLMTESKKAQMVFKGNSELCMTKLVTLFEDGGKANVISVEEAGFGVYKITFTK